MKCLVMLLPDSLLSGNLSAELLKKEKALLARVSPGFCKIWQGRKGLNFFHKVHCFPSAVFFTSCHVVLLGLTCPPPSPAAEALKSPSSARSSCSLLLHHQPHENVPQEGPSRRHQGFAKGLQPKCSNKRPLFVGQTGCMAAPTLPRRSSLSSYCAASQKKALKLTCP